MAEAAAATDPDEPRTILGLFLGHTPGRWLISAVQLAGFGMVGADVLVDVLDDDLAAVGWGAVGLGQFLAREFSAGRGDVEGLARDLQHHAGAIAAQHRRIALGGGQGAGLAVDQFAFERDLLHQSAGGAHDDGGLVAQGFAGLCGEGGEAAEQQCARVAAQGF